MHLSAAPWWKHDAEFIKTRTPLPPRRSLAHPSYRNAFIFVTRWNMSEIPIVSSRCFIEPRFRCFLFLSVRLTAIRWGPFRNK